MAQTTAVLAARYFFVDLVGGVIAFPIWWYTRGTLHTLAWARDSVRDSARALALGVWVRNLFVPMYGERGAEGRIISFFIRAAMIVLRGLAVGIWALIVGILVALYLVVPAAALVGLFFNLSGALALL